MAPATLAFWPGLSLLFSGYTSATFWRRGEDRPLGYAPSSRVCAVEKQGEASPSKILQLLPPTIHEKNERSTSRFSLVIGAHMGSDQVVVTWAADDAPVGPARPLRLNNLLASGAGL